MDGSGRRTRCCSRTLFAALEALCDFVGGVEVLADVDDFDSIDEAIAPLEEGEQRPGGIHRVQIQHRFDVRHRNRGVMLRRNLEVHTPRRQFEAEQPVVASQRTNEITHRHFETRFAPA